MFWLFLLVCVCVEELCVVHVRCCMEACVPCVRERRKNIICRGGDGGAKNARTSCSIPMKPVAAESKLWVRVVMASAAAMIRMWWRR